MVNSSSKFFVSSKFSKIDSLYAHIYKIHKSKRFVVSTILRVLEHQFPLIPCLNLRKQHKKILAQFKYKIISPIFIKKKNFFFYKKYFVQC